MNVLIESAVGTILVFSSHAEIAADYMQYLGYSLRQWSFLTDPEDLNHVPRGSVIFVLGDAGTIYNLQRIKDIAKEKFLNTFYITQ